MWQSYPCRVASLDVKPAGYGTAGLPEAHRLEKYVRGVDAEGEMFQMTRPRVYELTTERVSIATGLNRYRQRVTPCRIAHESWKLVQRLTNGSWALFIWAVSSLKERAGTGETNASTAKCRARKMLSKNVRAFFACWRAASHSPRRVCWSPGPSWGAPVGRLLAHLCSSNRECGYSQWCSMHAGWLSSLGVSWFLWFVRWKFVWSA